MISAGVGGLLIGFLSLMLNDMAVPFAIAAGGAWGLYCFSRKLP